MKNKLIQCSFIEKVVVLLVTFFYYCDFILYIGSESTISQKNITIYIFCALFVLLVLLNKISVYQIVEAPFFRWVTFYFIMSLFAFLYALILNGNSNEAFDAFRTVIFSTLILFLILGFLNSPKRLFFAQKCIVWGMVFSVIMNILGFWGILPLSITSGRAAGLYLNPNSSAMALGFGLVLVLDIVPRRIRTFFVLFIGFGIILTFSRSAIAFFVAFLVYYIFIQRGIPRYLKIFTASLFLLFSFLLNKEFSSFFNINQELNINSENRLDVISDPFRYHSEIANDTRVDVAKFALDKVFDRPIWGYGLGYNRNFLFEGEKVGAHNQYLAFLLDYGIFGLLLFASYFLMIIRNFNGRDTKKFVSFLIVIFYFAFFSHNYFDEYSMLFIHAFSWLVFTSKRYKLHRQLGDLNVSSFATTL